MSHEGNISMYYGAYALQNALEVAEDGDAICLSGGTFQGTNITKAIALYGTGIDVSDPTYIINNFNITIDGIHQFSMEGVRCTGEIVINGNLSNIQFLKCEFYCVYYASSLQTDVLFSNCKLNGRINYIGTTSTIFLNSFIQYPYVSETGKTRAQFINCVVSYPWDPSIGNSKYSDFINCVISTTKNNSNSLVSTCSAKNCVSINFSDAWKNASVKTNCKSATFEDVFKDFSGVYADTCTFELTDSAKTIFLGLDGTEVGIYGGSFPYDPTPTNPQITRCTVASKSTADGKLSVDIEVNGNKQ